MRFLMVPSILSPRVTSYSAVAAMIALARGVVKIDKNSSVIFLLPEPTALFSYEVPDSSDRLTFVTYPMYSRLPLKRGLMYVLPDQSILSQLVDVDVVYCRRIWEMPMIAEQFSNAMFIAVYGDVKIEIDRPIVQRFPFSQSLFPSYVLTNTASERERFLSTFQAVYTDRSVDCRFLPSSVILGDCLNAPRDITRKPVLFYGGSMATKKRVPDIVSMAERLWMLRAIDKLVVSTMDSKVSFDVKDWMEVYLEMLPDMYFDLLDQGDVFIDLSKYDSSILSPLVQLFNGQVGVFLEGDWVYETVGKDYPFVGVTSGEVLEIAAWVCQNLLVARKMLVEVITSLKERYSHISVARRFLMIVKEWHEDFVCNRS